MAPAKRVSPKVYSTSECFDSIRFSYVHGPAASIAEVVMPGDKKVPLGTGLRLQAGSQEWYGFTIDYRYSESSDKTTIQAVDWRDRLHDSYINAAFNMQEGDGAWYHIYPVNWKSQLRTYVSRAIEQRELFEVQRAADFVVHILAKTSLISSWAVLKWLSDNYGFDLVAEPIVEKILRSTYPPGLDWNSGARIIDAITQVCEKSNMQICAVGMRQLKITIKGYSQNPLVNKFIQRAISSCSINGDDASYGMQFHDKGRRVTITGGMNKYEGLFPCIPNWNKNWTWQLCYGGAALGALFEASGFPAGAPIRLKDLPKMYHDNETWESSSDLAMAGARRDKKTRNEMLVSEYLDKIVYKAYLIDFSSIVLGGLEPHEFETRMKYNNWFNSGKLEIPGFANGFWLDTLGEPLDHPNDITEDTLLSNSSKPIAESLATDVNVQYIVFATSRKVIQGSEHPFITQRTFTPMNSGVSMEVERVIGAETGEMTYRARLMFSEPQMIYTKEGMQTGSTHPKFITHDLPVVRVALLGDIYCHTEGEKFNGPRVREQKLNVPNLAKAYEFGEKGEHKELFFLAENFLINIGEKKGFLAQRGVKADDVAKSIAENYISRIPFQSSGEITFRERTGSQPDGIIENVSVSVGAQGMNESVSLGVSPASRRELIPPAVIRMSHKMLDETELNRMNLLEAAKKAWENAKRAASEKKGWKAGDIAAGDLSILHQEDSFSRRGLVDMAYDGSVTNQIPYKPGDVVVTKVERRQV